MYNSNNRLIGGIGVKTGKNRKQLITPKDVLTNKGIVIIVLMAVMSALLVVMVIVQPPDWVAYIWLICTAVLLYFFQNEIRQ